MNTFGNNIYKAKPFKLIDQLILEKILSDYIYEDLIIPSTIDDKTLETFKYYKKNPNHIFELCSVNHDILTNVSETNAMPISTTNLSMEGISLTPSACFAIYPYYDNKDILANKEYFIATSLVKVYRKESEITRFRMQEYNVREVVIFAEEKKLNKIIGELELRIKTIFNEDIYPIKIVGATDEFFYTEKNKKFQLFQKANAFKKEMIATTVEGIEVACGSINYHSNSISKNFNYRNSNIQTACIGFGLDRIMELRNKK